MSEFKDPKYVELITTDDGSHSLYLSALDETYHSRKGAINESNYVFISQGLRHFKGPHIHLLEIGFGTGLNALLAALEVKEKGGTIHYTSIEKYPLSQETISALNYPKFLTDDAGIILNKIHQTSWNQPQEIIDGFILLKHQADATKGIYGRGYDLVFFDAFGPDKQPEMWTEDMFRSIFAAMNPGGVLVTYSAKGAMRRSLTELGFEVKRLEGPIGKKHMTRAIKPK
jgi:tRNA U34 5-methylaminomethyl-2-thiouridine-forming methyltransferase MnmC